MQLPISTPALVAFVSFDPATPGTLLSGSWGVLSVTATIGAQAFDVLLSPEISGTILLADSVALHIVPCVHEAWTGQTITPLAGGFSIDFGAPLTRVITIEVKRRNAQS